jgi:hypothetical protein
VSIPTTGAPASLDEITLEEFAVRYLDDRDELAFRELRGERLTARERSYLDELNAGLDRLLPTPAGLPADVRAAMAEVRRLAGR